MEDYDTVAIVKFQSRVSAHERACFLESNLQPLRPRSFGYDMLTVVNCLQGNATGILRGVFRVINPRASVPGFTPSNPIPPLPKTNVNYIFFGSKAINQKLKLSLYWEEASHSKEYPTIFVQSLANNEYLGFAIFETRQTSTSQSEDRKAVLLYSIASAFQFADDRTVTLLCQGLSNLRLITGLDPRADKIEGTIAFDSQRNEGWFKSKFAPILRNSYASLSPYGKACSFNQFEDPKYGNLENPLSSQYLAIVNEFLNFMSNVDANQQWASYPRRDLYWSEKLFIPDIFLSNKVVDMVFSARSVTFKRFMLRNWLGRRPSDQNVSRLMDFLESDSVIERGSVLDAFDKWNWKTYRDIDLKPKGNWQDGRSAIENEAFLQQFWREHPP